MEIQRIPMNIFFEISCFLPISSILKLSLTCKRISKILTNEFLWQKIAIREHGMNQEKPDYYISSWKQFVKEGLFHFESTNNTKYHFMINEKKRVEKINGMGPKSIFSKQSIRGKGKYCFSILVNIKHPDCFCIGVTNNDYNSINEYICNVKEGRGIAGNGFCGLSSELNENGDRQSEVTFGGEGKSSEKLNIVVDLDSKKLIISNESQHCQQISISELSIENGLKFSATISSPGDFISILSSKWLR